MTLKSFVKDKANFEFRKLKLKYCIFNPEKQNESHENKQQTKGFYHEIGFGYWCWNYCSILYLWNNTFKKHNETDRRPW